MSSSRQGVCRAFGGPSSTRRLVPLPAHPSDQTSKTRSAGVHTPRRDSDANGEDRNVQGPVVARSDDRRLFKHRIQDALRRPRRAPAAAMPEAAGRSRTDRPAEGSLHCTVMASFARCGRESRAAGCALWSGCLRASEMRRSTSEPSPASPRAKEPNGNGTRKVRARAGFALPEGYAELLGRLEREIGAGRARSRRGAHRCLSHAWQA